MIYMSSECDCEDLLCVKNLQVGNPFVHLNIRSKYIPNTHKYIEYA